jgi:hypothetical protein
MNRREFLLSAALVARLRPSRSILDHQSLSSEGWRIFEIKTHVHVQNASGVTRVWLPTPLVGAPYQQTLGDTYVAENGRVVMVESEELDLLFGEWIDGADPILDLTSRLATRAYAVDVTKPTVAPPADFAAFAKHLHPTSARRFDAAFRAAAAKMAGSGTDLERARRIFDLVRGEKSPCDFDCGNPSEKFAALARAVGIPSRVLYGLALGAADATKAQHARAEVYLVGFGWVPLDVASGAFGSWDGNWFAFNSAQDVPLPKAKHGALPFFMHPQAETADGLANSLDPATFRYDISVRETA